MLDLDKNGRLLDTNQTIYYALKIYFTTNRTGYHHSWYTRKAWKFWHSIFKFLPYKVVNDIIWMVWWVKLKGSNDSEFYWIHISFSCNSRIIFCHNCRSFTFWCIKTFSFHAFFAAPINRYIQPKLLINSYIVEQWY